MKNGSLSQYFKGVAAKRLSAVEARPEKSNQHEFDGVKKLVEVLGPFLPRRRFDATFFYFSDDEVEPLQENGWVTWYDARENHATRSEARLYFPTTRVSENATDGDLLLIARKPDDSLLVIIAEKESTIENQLLWLMGQTDLTHPRFSIKSEIENDQVRLDFVQRLILEEIGVEATETDDNYLEQMLREFGGEFPETYKLSAFAQKLLSLDPRDDPDGVLTAWYEKEYILYRTLEEHFLSSRIKQGFPTVKEFLDLSLSVQNRRKSRAGNALQNHLTPIFTACGLKFETQKITENRQKPDYLFPGYDEYHDQNYPSEKLRMLAAKTSCKDRWRQMLAEAARITSKHICTLEAGISENQTNQMIAHQVQLVIPRKYHVTFSASQRSWIKTLADFITDIKKVQS